MRDETRLWFIVRGVLCTEIIVSDLETAYGLFLIDYLPDMACGYKGRVRNETRLRFAMTLKFPKALYGRVFIDHLPDKDCGYKLSSAILHVSGHETCGVPISADWSAATRTMTGMMVTDIMGIYEMDRDVQICWVCRLSRSFLGSLLA